MDKKALTTYEIASYCHVTPRTVVQWVNEGKLKTFRTPGNHSRVEMADFIAFLNTYHMRIPDELAAYTKSAKTRILIVDDDISIVDSIKLFLKPVAQYELAAAYDGFEAGEKYAEFKPELVVVDINMPGLDGYKVCSRIRSQKANANVKILIISATMDQQTKTEALSAGADDYLAKPFNAEEMRMKIAELLNQARK